EAGSVYTVLQNFFASSGDVARTNARTQPGHERPPCRRSGKTSPVGVLRVQKVDYSWTQKSENATIGGGVRCTNSILSSHQVDSVAPRPVEMCTRYIYSSNKFGKCWGRDEMTMAVVVGVDQF
ncbi:unnamed protein product, partial [Laminaria digitata]